MTMNIPPPDPGSVAALVEVAAAEAAGDQVLGEVRPGGPPIDMRAERRQAPPRAAPAAPAPAGLRGRDADPAVLDVLRRSPVIASPRTTRSTSTGHPARVPNARTSWEPIVLGRDVLSRVMAGARDVLIAAPTAAILGVAAGTMLGLLMGYYRGWVDEIFSRIIEALLSIPVILMALLITASLGSSRIVVIVHRRGAVHAHRHPHRARRRAVGVPARLRHVRPVAGGVRAVRDDA